jgi:cellulase/cellobiase CelA1
MLGPRIQENSPALLMPNTTNAKTKSVTSPPSTLSSPQTVCLATPSPTLTRNAVQGLRLAWGDWCNVNGAGFGVGPTSDTGDDLEDAFVWVKPGRESDGTSDPTADRYDSFCGSADAFKRSPQAGQWNEAYFEMLLKNAIPAFT